MITTVLELMTASESQALWWLLFITTATGRGLQIYDVIEKVFDYPPETAIRIVFNPLEVPAASYCNNSIRKIMVLDRLSCKDLQVVSTGTNTDRTGKYAQLTKAAKTFKRRKKRQGRYECDFESSNMCQWTNDKTHDQFDWTLGRGPTPSPLTGPSVDHTSGSGQGYYVFVEASSSTANPRMEDDKAWLVSETFLSASPTCAKFWYHMYGIHTGTLRVWIQSNNGALTPIWEQSGNKGDRWFHGRVAIPTQTGSYKVIYEAIRGTSWAGDIALDDVSFDTTLPCIRHPESATPTINGTPGITSTTVTAYLETTSTTVGTKSTTITRPTTHSTLGKPSARISIVAPSMGSLVLAGLSVMAVFCLRKWCKRRRQNRTTEQMYTVYTLETKMDNTDPPVPAPRPLPSRPGLKREESVYAYINPQHVESIPEDNLKKRNCENRYEMVPCYLELIETEKSCVAVEKFSENDNSTDYNSTQYEFLERTAQNEQPRELNTNGNTYCALPAMSNPTDSH